MKELTLEELNYSLLNIHYVLEGLLDILGTHVNTKSISADLVEAIFLPHISALRQISLDLSNKIDRGAVIEIIA